MTGQQLRNSILQFAVQGKLVPQVLTDEPAITFLSRIRREKDQMIRTGKIKKENPLAPILEEDVPFSIPQGWSWVRLGDYCERITDQVASGSFASLRDNVKSLKEPSYALMVKTADFANGFTRNLTYTDEHGYQFLNNSNLFGGELILSNIGSIGKVFIVPKMTIPMTLAPNSVMIRLMSDAQRDYLYWFLLSPLGYDELMEITSGTALKKFNKTDLKTILIPVPPINEQKRIVEKIEELLPLVDEYDKAAGELEALNMILPDKLRKSVLQEAIHGTLVSNDIPEGEATGAELLQQILKERQEKENKEKGKKAKKLTLSTIEEEPWELPEEWCWCKIGDIFDHSAGKSLNSSKQSIGKVYPYLTTSNVYYEGINFEKVKEMPFTEEEYKKCSAIKNDILVCEGGDVGRSCIWTYDYSIGLQNHVHRLRAIKDTDVKFVNYVLRFYKAAGIITAKGIGIGGFSANALKGLSIPLPPLSIQHRIVEKIEEVFSAIDKLQA